MNDLEIRLREQLHSVGQQAPHGSELRTQDAPQSAANAQQSAEIRQRWGIPAALAIGVAAVTVSVAILTGAPTADIPRPGPAQSAEIPTSPSTPLAEAEYPRNASGESYGGLKDDARAPEPDLVAVVAENGRSGYVRNTELYSPPPANPSEAVEQQRRRDARAARGETVDRYIPVYDQDGKTKIGVFPISLGR